MRVFGGPELFARFFSTGEGLPGTVGGRWELWRAAWRLWRQHPLLGIGAGNFELELGRAGLPGVRTHANSLFLQSLVEGGVPLLCAWLYTFGAAIVSFARGPFRQPLVAGALGAAIGLGLHHTVDFMIFFPKFGLMFWAAMALGAAGQTDSTL